MEIERETDADGTEHIVVAKLIGKVDTENRISVQATGCPKDIFKILIDFLGAVMSQSKQLPPAMVFFAQGLMAVTMDLVEKAEAFQKEMREHHPENATHEEIDLSWMEDALKNVKEKPEEKGPLGFQPPKKG